MNEKIFREYDIRGIAGEDITRDTSVAIGKAFGTYLNSQIKTQNSKLKVSIGRDIRNTSKELASGLIEGIISTGINVYNIGICPTPVQYFSLFHLDLDGGIMVTGSHNPPEYNGFKISIGKETIYGDTIQRLKEIVLKKGWITANKAGRAEKYDIINDYKKYMLNEFSYLNDSRYRKLKVVVDAGNGTAGILVPQILKDIGCEVTPLYCEPDGNFPNHHPDPTVLEYIQGLINETIKTGADFGVGYDGDADRIGIVNRNGDIIWGDHLMIILSREVLKQNKGAKIIGDVKCSQLMFDDIKKHGGIPIMWKTGHSLIKQKMKNEQAILAGEFSGHIFIADRYFGYDDAIYTTMRLVEIIKTSGKELKELLSDISRMAYTPEIRIDCGDGIKKKVVEKVIERLVWCKNNGCSPYEIMDFNTIDGVRVVFEKGWTLLRASNTQPVLVMRAEASDDLHLEKYRFFMERELKEVIEEAH